jgi:hypothetical protein
MHQLQSPLKVGVDMQHEGAPVTLFSAAGAARLTTDNCKQRILASKAEVETSQCSPFKV